MVVDLLEVRLEVGLGRVEVRGKGIGRLEVGGGRTRDPWDGRGGNSGPLGGGGGQTGIEADLPGEVFRSPGLARLAGIRYH